MKKSLSVLALVLTAALSSTASATVVSSSAGLASYTELVNFSAPSLATGTVVTNQFAAQGLTFSNLSGAGVRANGCGANTWNGYGYTGIAGDFLHTYSANCTFTGTVDAFSMKFAGDVGAASFALYSYGNNAVNAYNDGVLVDVYNTSSGVNDFVTFSNVVFDELRFVSGVASNYMIVDTVAFQNANVVPEPASLALFGLGLAGLAGLRRQRGK